jgi:hypothetical protein
MRSEFHVIDNFQAGTGAWQLFTHLAAFAFVMAIFRQLPVFSSSRHQTPLYLDRKIKPLLSLQQYLFVKQEL